MILDRLPRPATAAEACHPTQRREALDVARIGRRTSVLEWLFALLGLVPVQPPDGNEGGDRPEEEETRQQRSLDGPCHEPGEIVNHVRDERKGQAVEVRS